MSNSPILYHGRTLDGLLPSFKPAMRQANRAGRQSVTRRLCNAKTREHLSRGRLGVDCPQDSPEGRDVRALASQHSASQINAKRGHAWAKNDWVWATSYTHLP